MPQGPLAGVTVVENASYISGPYAGPRLAQLGADVVKVEARGSGDPFRRWGGTTAGKRARPRFTFYHSERSVALDLGEAAGRGAVVDRQVRETGLLRQATAPGGESFLVPRGAVAFAGDLDACSMEVAALGAGRRAGCTGSSDHGAHEGLGHHRRNGT